MQNLPFYVDETGGLSVAQLAARARRLKRQRGLDLLMIDYLQLLQGSTRRSSENRVQEITEITTKLKALAKELNVPIMALSQLSRQVESRDDKRPQLSDLRESGSIEQDADVVLFVFREEYYHQMRKPLETNREKFAEWLAEGEKVHGSAEVIIGKQRHGPTGTVEMQFEGSITQVLDLGQGRPPAGAHRLAPARPHGRPALRPLNPSPWPRQKSQFTRMQARRTRFRRTDRHRRAAGGAGRRHPHRRSRGDRSQLAGARPARHAGGMRRRDQGRRLWLRHRAGRGRARQGRLQDVLRRRPRRGAARPRGRAGSRRSMCSTACSPNTAAAYADLARGR